MESNQKDKPTPENISYHEAMDRTYIQLSSLEMALAEHPAIQNEKETQRLYDQAVVSLAELYQRLGEKYLEQKSS